VNGKAANHQQVVWVTLVMTAGGVIKKKGPSKGRGLTGQKQKVTCTKVNLARGSHGWESTTHLVLVQKEGGEKVSNVSHLGGGVMLC